MFFFCLSLVFVGEKGAVRQHKSTFHAVASVVRQEGFLELYNG